MGESLSAPLFSSSHPTFYKSNPERLNQLKRQRGAEREVKRLKGEEAEAWKARVRAWSAELSRRERRRSRAYADIEQACLKWRAKNSHRRPYEDWRQPQAKNYGSRDDFARVLALHLFQEARLTPCLVRHGHQQKHPARYEEGKRLLGSRLWVGRLLVGGVAHYSPHGGLP